MPESVCCQSEPLDQFQPDASQLAAWLRLEVAAQEGGLLGSGGANLARTEVCAQS